jgi:ribonuclease I
MSRQNQGPLPPRQGQRVRFDLDDDATYVGSSSDEHSGSDEMGSNEAYGTQRNRNNEMRRDRTSTENDEAPPTRSILQVGSISALMLFFVSVSVVHLTIRYNSLETNPVVPNFPDHLNSHSHLRGKNTTLEMSTLITADDGPVAPSHAGSIIVPIQEHAEEEESDEGEATKFDSVESQIQAEDLLVEADDQEKGTESADFEEDFDMFLFTMSYQPEFCHSHHSSSFPGCMSPNMNYTTHLTIHGLWPERSNGGYPQNCKPEEAELDPEVIQELASQFTRFWPDEKNPHMEDPTQMMEFYAHEWAKHGTCTNLTQLEYFSAAFAAYIVPDPPTIIQDFYGQEVSAVKLQAAFEQATSSLIDETLSNDNDYVVGFGGVPREQQSSVVLICSGHKYLEEIRICLSNEKGGPGKAMPCPDAVVKSMARDKCQGDTVMLSKFKESTTGRSHGNSNSVKQFAPVPVADKYHTPSLSHLPLANAVAHDDHQGVSKDVSAQVYYANRKKVPVEADGDEEPSLVTASSSWEVIPIPPTVETEDEDDVKVANIVSVEQDEDEWEPSPGGSDKSNGDTLMM